MSLALIALDWVVWLTNNIPVKREYCRIELSTEIKSVFPAIYMSYNVVPVVVNSTIDE